MVDSHMPLYLKNKNINLIAEIIPHLGVKPRALITLLWLLLFVPIHTREIDENVVLLLKKLNEWKVGALIS